MTATDRTQRGKVAQQHNGFGAAREQLPVGTEFHPAQVAETRVVFFAGPNQPSRICGYFAVFHPEPVAETKERLEPVCGRVRLAVGYPKARSDSSIWTIIRRSSPFDSIAAHPNLAANCSIDWLNKPCGQAQSLLPHLPHWSNHNRLYLAASSKYPYFRNSRLKKGKPRRVRVRSNNDGMPRYLSLRAPRSTSLCCRSGPICLRSKPEPPLRRICLRE